MLDETREGLDTGAAGAGDASAASPAAGAAETPATGAAQQAALPDNLDEHPGFKKHKSLMDQKVADATKLAEEARERAETAERQLQERQTVENQAEQARVMREGTPQEVATYWQGRAQMMEEQITTQNQQQQYVQQMTDRAEAMLKDLGLDFNTPGLDKEGGVSPDGFARLAVSAAAIAAKTKTAEQKVATDAVGEAARQGHLQGLKDAGVTSATLGTPGGDSGSIAEITDSTTLLKMAFKKAEVAGAAKKGKG